MNPSWRRHESRDRDATYSESCSHASGGLESRVGRRRVVAFANSSADISSYQSQGFEGCLVPSRLLARRGSRNAEMLPAVRAAQPIPERNGPVRRAAPLPPSWAAEACVTCAAMGAALLLLQREPSLDCALGKAHS
eukprot:5657390-Pleurochrysis_carterae.AAC.3